MAVNYCSLISKFSVSDFHTQMEFDPLSLFTPRQTQNLEDEQVYEPIVTHKPEESPLESSQDTENDHLIPLHIFDLPMLQMKPPGDVLIMILKLLAINEVWNFNQCQESQLDPMTVFKEKQVDLSKLDLCLKWMSDKCSRFDSILKLSAVPTLSLALKQNPSYNDWLTKIISNDLQWISQDDKTRVYKEASLRISENCGRTAQPEIIRKIKLNNMERLNRDYIKLKEPSLTSDNLGLKTWGSSLILGQRLINQANNEKLKEPILELGSGTGLIGIICLLLGHKDIYVTDLAPIIPNLKENTLVNNLDIDNENNSNGLETNMNKEMNMNMHIEELDWANPISFINKYPNVKFNTIILSDPIYSSDHPTLIAEVLKQFVNRNTDVLIQVPLRRNYEDIRQKLWDLLEPILTETSCELQVGSDEFGDTQYCFKTFKINHNN